MIEQAKGQILRIDEKFVRYKCECGNQMTVNTNESDPHNICQCCGSEYILQYTVTVWEKIE